MNAIPINRWDAYSDAEKGAILLARESGKSIQRHVDVTWVPMARGEAFFGSLYYRIAPVEITQTSFVWALRESHTGLEISRKYRFTINLADGEPLHDSVTMKPLITPEELWT